MLATAQQSLELPRNLPPALHDRFCNARVSLDFRYGRFGTIVLVGDENRRLLIAPIPPGREIHQKHLDAIYQHWLERNNACSATHLERPNLCGLCEPLSIYETVYAIESVGAY